MRNDPRSVTLPLGELLSARASNRSSRARTLPVGGNAEFYLKEGKPVLRRKSSAVPTLPQQTALAVCASRIKGKEFASRVELYKELDKCMAEQGFEGK